MDHILIWNDSLKLGIDSVDEQHYSLLDLINRLDEAVALGHDPTAIGDLLDALIDYTRYHFDEEEKLMRAAGFDDSLYDAHREEHRVFVETILQARNEQPDHASFLLHHLLDFLFDWLYRHILGTDKKMVLRLLGQKEAANAEIDKAGMIMQRNLYSALRESEDRFKKLADHLPALIWISNARNTHIFCNHYWHSIFKIADDAPASQWLSRIHPDDRNKVRDAYTQAADTSKAVKLQYRLLYEDRSVRWLLETAVPRIRRNGCFAGLMGCGMDITNQKNAEITVARLNQSLMEQVSQRTQELVEANRTLEAEKNEQIRLNTRLKETQAHLLQSEKLASIGQLAAGIAHEINNPLGYIHSNLHSLQSYLSDLLSFTESAERLAGHLPANDPELLAYRDLKKRLDIDFLKSDLTDLIDESIEGANRAKKIVQDLRDFSRIDKQQRELFDIEAGIDATLNIIHNELKHKAIIDKRYCGLEPYLCKGAQLNQVFMNLLVNAAHAIEDFGTIRILTRYRSNQILIEIEDTGSGIPDEIRTRLFEPFFTTKAVGKGTGLGLSMSYQIIEAHRGTIEVASTVGKGSLFRVCLPKHPPEN